MIASGEQWEKLEAFRYGLCLRENRPTHRALFGATIRHITLSWWLPHARATTPILQRAWYLAFLRGFPKNGIYEVRTFFGLETGNWKKLRFQALATDHCYNDLVGEWLSLVEHLVRDLRCSVPARVFSTT
jgi:hypothetical protein